MKKTAINIFISKALIVCCAVPLFPSVALGADGCNREIVSGIDDEGPQPTNPEPTNPEPTNPEPTNPEPTNPEPTNPEPTNPEPTNPEPTNPEPTNPEPTNPEPTDPEPTTPTYPTGATGAGGLYTASAFGGMTRASSDTPNSNPCSATVVESIAGFAQEIAMTIGTKIINQRAVSLGSFGGGASADNTLLNSGRFSLFSFADFSERDRQASTLSGGYEQEMRSFTLGFDYRIDDTTFFGASLSGSDGESELDTGLGGSDVASTTFGIHGAKYWDNSFVAGFLAYGALDIDLNRSTLTDSFSATTDGGYWYGDISIGFEENYGGLRVTPMARLLFLSGEIDGYRERSASGTGVIRSIDKQEIDSNILSLSVQADYAVLLSWGVLLPSMRLEFVADGGDAYQSNGQNLNDTDKSAISSFTDQADDPDSSTVSVSWGASAQFKQGFAAYLVYERLFLHDYLDRYTATLGVRYELP